MKSYVRLIAIMVLLALLASGPVARADANSRLCLGTKLAAILYALYTELKWWSPLTWVDTVRSAIKHKKSMGMPVTRRGVLRYLWQLHLTSADFKGKRILDVGSGQSMFVPWLNRYFGNTGTQAVAIDLAATRGFKNDQFARANATQLPFADNTFDLTTSSWFLNNWSRPWLTPSITAKGRANRVQKIQLLRTAIEEMIRVTKPGGEIRLARTVFEFLAADAKPVLENHPKIAKVEYTPAGLVNGCIRILLK